MSRLRMGLGGDAEAAFEFPWRDVFLNSLLVILMLLIVILFKVHPVKKDAKKEADSPGNVVVEMTWNNERDIDLDLWVQAPGDTPVGYSARAGKYFDLLRDDLGYQSDITKVNMEHAYSRGIPAGEYCVNVHLYRHDQKEPIEAVLVVRSQETRTSPPRELLTTKVTLKANGQEVTAFRFRLKEDGTLVAGSVHSIFKPVRSQQS